MKKKLAIIGAGIAGLTLANLLKKYSKHEFILYEKEDSLSLDQGYGIQLSTNSIQILNQINFKKIDNKKIYHPNGVDFYNIKNEKICNLDINRFNTNESKYTTLLRSTLFEFLKDEIYTQHLRFGKKIKEVSEIKEKILIKFEDNSNDLVDFVIGADGIFSSTKSFFEKRKINPKFRKAIAVRGILKSKLDLDINEKNISLIMGKNCHLAIYPINKNNDFNLVCIIRNKIYDPDNIKSLIKQKVLNQNINLKKLFDGELKTWPLYSTTSIVPSSNNKVFYIGDAFSGFLPTLAQGASQSIESAYELFNLLKEEKSDVQSTYFNERYKRANIIKKRSNFNFFVFHFSSSIMQSFRNFFMKFLVKRKSFINSYLGKVYKN
tara:strand:- start:663 stop:1796 length:1134 start_codon:yes stop_codon:yes gene_type:complete